MNRDVMEAASNILSARAAQNDELWHYGTPRHSGRFPYGSGKRPHQHDSGSKGPSGTNYGITLKDTINGYKQLYKDSKKKWSYDRKTQDQNQQEINKMVKNTDKVNFYDRLNSLSSGNIKFATPLTAREIIDKNKQNVLTIKQEDINKINSHRDKATDYFNQACDIGEKEFKESMKTKEFKEDLLDQMYQYCNGIKDDYKKDYFDLELDYTVNDMMWDEKYTPKAHDYISKMNKEINDYYDDCKSVSEDILGVWGNMPLRNSTKTTYKGVAYEYLISSDGAWMRYMYNHPEYAWDFTVEPNDIITYDDYLKYEKERNSK